MTDVTTQKFRGRFTFVRTVVKNLWLSFDRVLASFMSVNTVISVPSVVSLTLR